MDRSLRNDPAFLRIEPYSAESIGYYVTIDRLSRVTRPPANDITPQPTLGENIPKRLAFARSASVRSCPAVYRVGLDEAVDAMLIGKFSGRDRVPKHW